MFTYAPYQYDLHPLLIGVQAEFKVMGAGRSDSYRTCTLPPPLKEFSMNELIPLQSQTIDGNAVETVNARELHAFLESKQDFSTWIKNRIEKYDFVENHTSRYGSTKKWSEKSVVQLVLNTTSRLTWQKNWQ